MLQNLGSRIGDLADTLLHELGVVVAFATRSPATFAVVAAVTVAVLVMIALARR